MRTERPPYVHVDADRRAAETEAQMTDEERYAMLFSLMPIEFRTKQPDPRVPADAAKGAGYVAGVPRLGVPAVTMTDASLGVTCPPGYRPGDTATAFPAGIALGATFNPALGRRMGEVIGAEARVRGFNVALGGGINLMREVRGGRNFEYVSEDPLLSGIMGGEIVAGIQSQQVIGTLKHLSLNVSETNKFTLDAQIDPTAHRESDLLAFELAIERGEPGTLMAAYNKVNGAYCAGNDAILDGVIKGPLGYKGWIHSDWHAVYSWDYALKGLDQQSGAQLDEKEWFNEPLQAAVREGRVPKARISDMVRRMLRSYFAVGIDAWESSPEVDAEANALATLETARQAIVLIKNEGGLLPLASQKKIAVIGGHADVGVVAGGGSSQGSPPDGQVLTIPWGGEGPIASIRREVYFGSSPMIELKRLLPDAVITYDPGAYPATAAALARRSDAVLIFATRFESEGFDSPDLSLPFGQDALIETVAAANPNVIVILETGNPIAMPWRDRVKAILQLWFPGQSGGQAIAEVLAGRSNPSGRLPMTWPIDIAQTPHKNLPGFENSFGTPVAHKYHEGAEVGYRWFAKTGQTPLLPFGFGLSYTDFEYGDLAVTGGETIAATFSVTNVGSREGADVPQLYLIEAPDGRRMRLLGFERVMLQPGERGVVSVSADPRLLGRFDGDAGEWRIAAGEYTVGLAKSAAQIVATAQVEMAGRRFGK
jgi:beta-glucosidase